MRVGAKLERAGRGRWVERAGRLGFAARGAIYGVVGLLAIQIPLGLGGRATDREGAIQTIAQQPFGEFLLFALAAGLAGYALWRIASGLVDRQHEGAGAKGLAKRAGFVAIGIAYAAAAVATFAILAGSGSGGSNEREDTAWVLSLPFGPWIVAAVGLAFIGAGGFNAYRSLTQKFRKHLREHAMPDAERRWVVAVGVAGHAARGAVFCLIGAFLVRAAYQYDPKEAVGLDGALKTVAQAEYGDVLLGLVAAGLLAYALFCFVEARYRAV